VSHFLDILNRRKRSLRFRAQAANRHLRNSLKHLHKTAPVGRISLSEAGAACNSKAEFLQSMHDATLRLAPGTMVPCSSLRNLVASQGCANRAALEHSLSESHFETPEILVGRFRDCIAEPRTIRLITRDSNLIIETSSIHGLLDPDLVESDHLTMRRRKILQVARRHEWVDEDVLFAFNSFTPSYGHYVLTSLPLIFAFLDEIKQGLLKIIMPAGYPHWMRNHLLELGLDDNDFLILRDAAYRFRSAIASNILDARNTRAPNPGSLTWLSGVLGQLGTVQAPNTKLYVKRSGSSDVSSRTISNEAEVIEALELLGFRAIEPTRMSLREQVSAFHQATVVVSPHGSSLANLLFCQPGTKVLDLMPDGWVGARGNSIRDVWAARICALAQLDYSVLLCPSQTKSRHHTGNPTIAYNVVVSDLLGSLRTI
jgi:capsular polysaccharide biosynthesis protein